MWFFGKHDAQPALEGPSTGHTAAAPSSSAAAGAAVGAAAGTTVHHHADDNITLTVEQPPDGFWVSLRLLARIPLPPDEVYEILTAPDNAKYFRSIKALRNRRVVSDTANGARQEIEVDQVGRWRFGPFGGSFSVRLAVTQDRRRHTMDFRLIPTCGAFMSDFSGGWRIQPYDADALEEMTAGHPKHWGPLHGMRRALHRLEDQLTGRHANSSLVELRQCVAPKMVPPHPLDRVLKKVTARQVRTVMEDLLAEAERRNAERTKRREEEQRAADRAALETHIKRLTSSETEKTLKKHGKH